MPVMGLVTLTVEPVVDWVQCLAPRAEEFESHTALRDAQLAGDY